MEKLYPNFLFIIFLLLAFTLFLLLFKKLFSRTARSYKLKGPYLLSHGEKVFFDALIQAIPPELYICPKVRIADLIEVDLPKSNRD